MTAGFKLLNQFKPAVMLQDKDFSMLDFSTGEAWDWDRNRHLFHVAHIVGLSLVHTTGINLILISIVLKAGLFLSWFILL